MSTRLAALWIATALVITATVPNPMAENSLGITAPVTWEQVLALPGEGEAPETHRYGTAPQQSLLALQGQARSRGVILLIHGGCWSNAYDREHTLPMARALSEAGYAVWVPEYRRVGDPGGGWRGTLDDIISSVRFVAHETGASPWLVGHSAGGHLSLRAALEPDLPIAGVVGLAAITNLSTYGAQEGSCQAMVHEFLAASPETDPQRYAAASVTPAQLATPFRLLRGELDGIVGADQHQGFDPERVLQIEGAGHFDLIHPKTDAFQQVFAVLDALIHHDSR